MAQSASWTVLDSSLSSSSVTGRALDALLGVGEGQVNLGSLREPLRNDISKAAAVGHFDVTPEVVDEVVDEAVGRLITGLSEQKRASVARMVGAAYRNEWSEAELGRVLADMVGLDAVRVARVEAFRLGLVDAGVPRGLARDRARKVARSLRRDRANIIARTELNNLIGEAKRRTWERAKEDGEIDQYVVRIWHTHPDERRCKVCRPMNAQRAAIGRPYKRNGLTGPPVHPNCRCWETLERGPVVLAKTTTVTE